MFERKKKTPRKNYICPKCEGKVILEYTEKFGWHSRKPDVTSIELKCPECNRIFTIKESRKK